MDIQAVTDDPRFGVSRAGRRSIRTLRIVPPGETLVMVVTVATVVMTHDLAKGVAAG